MVMKFLKEIRRNQAGMILPLVLMLLCIVSFIIIPGLQTATQSLVVNGMVQRHTVAYYAADAGIADVLWKFKHATATSITASPFYYDLPSDINGMKVRVSRVSESGTTNKTYVISSKAALTLNGDPLSTVYASINVGSTGGFPFQYALATTNGNIDINYTAKIKSLPNPPGNQADVYANGNIDVRDISTGYINGNASATQHIIDDECNPCNTADLPIPYDHDKIKGISVSHTTENVTFQSLNEQYYWDLTGNGTTLPASWMPSGIPAAYTGFTYDLDADDAAYHPSHTIYLGGTGNISRIRGNLKLDGNIILKGTVWVTGWIYFPATSCKLTPEDPTKQYYFIAQGTDPSTAPLGMKQPDINGNNIYYSIVAEEGVTMNSAGNLSFIADTKPSGTGGIVLKGAIKRTDGGLPRLGIFFAPNGTVFLDAPGEYETGPVIGQNIRLDSNVTVNYNTALRLNDELGYQINEIKATMTGYSGQ